MQREVSPVPQQFSWTRRRLAALLVVVVACVWLGLKQQACANPPRLALPLQLAAGQVPAPAGDPLDGGIAWLNTAKPLSMADLKGRVVLLDFWTLC